MLNYLRPKFTDETGATAIEYALIAGMIALVIVTTVGLVGAGLQARFTEIATLL